jgi:hypothetical protein
MSYPELFKSSLNSSSLHPKGIITYFFDGDEKNWKFFSSPSKKYVIGDFSHMRKIRDDSWCEASGKKLTHRVK